MSDLWAELAEEFVRRENEGLRAELDAAGIDYGWVDAGFDGGVESYEDVAFHGWRQVVGRGGSALLLAVYIYSSAQLAWELSTGYEPIESTIEAAWRGWQRAGTVDDENAGAVELILRHARSLRHCMEAERALNCSCSILMGRMARQVVAESAALLAESGRLGPGAHEFRTYFLDPVLRSHREFYDAVARSADAVLTWIGSDDPAAARPAVRDAAAFVSRQERDPDIRRDVYASELRAHRKVLETVAGFLDDPSVPAVRLDEAGVCYQYPFALDGVDGPGVLRWIEKSGGGYTSDLTDIWTWSATRPPHFTRFVIGLPDLVVHTTDDRDLRHIVEVCVSGLGNHYVRIRRRLADATTDPATLHDVNQAMRRASRQMGTEEIRWIRDRGGRLTPPPWTPAEPVPGEHWHGLPDCARDIATSFVEALNAGRTKVVLVMDEGALFHVTLEVRQISAHRTGGDYAPAGPAELLRAAAPLLLHPVRPQASGLEEWVRNPPRQLENLAGDNCLDDDVVVRTANTTVLVVPSTPNWVMLGHEEMAEFAASLPVLFQLWRRQLDRVDPVTGEVDDMNELALGEVRIDLLDHVRSVRRQLAVLHSPELVETAGHRGFLDRLYRAAGLPRLQAQLENSVGEVEAAHREVLAQIARRERDREDRHRGRVELVLATLSVFSVAEFFGYLNDLFKWLSTSPVARAGELAAIATIATAIVLVSRPAASSTVSRVGARLSGLLRLPRLGRMTRDPGPHDER